MNKLKKSIVGAVTALLLVLAMASSAQAYSYTQGPEKWQFDRSGIYCGVWAYVDYDWWEELWGYRDGWQRLYWAYC